METHFLAFQTWFSVALEKCHWVGPEGRALAMVLGSCLWLHGH